MSTKILSDARLSENTAYDQGMGNKTVKHRPPQGARLYNLRIAAGLTQVELGEIVGERHSNIAFWEKSEKPPRSDVLPALARALGVSVEDLLLTGPSFPTHKGPVGKLRRAFEDASKLPRGQQEKVVDVINAVIRGLQGTPAS